MTGIPQFNYPAFDEATKYLRDHGYTVVSPAELDDPEIRAAALASPDGKMGSGSVNGETWGDFLSRDVKLIADKVDIIVVIPGWEKSRGARLETFVGYALCGKSVFKYPDFEPVPEHELAAAWVGNLEVDIFAPLRSAV